MPGPGDDEPEEEDSGEISQSNPVDIDTHSEDDNCKDLGRF